MNLTIYFYSAYTFIQKFNTHEQHIETEDTYC